MQLHKIDPWRHFNCVYTQGVGNPEEMGILAVKPILYLPALFWTYALHDIEGEQLFSFENGIVGDCTYFIVVGDNSKSIPAGLLMRIWEQSLLVQFYRSRFDNNHWSIIRVKGQPNECSTYQRYMDNGAFATLRPAIQKEKESLNDRSVYLWNYIFGV